MNNLTVLFYTANRIPEHFARKVQEQLLSAVGWGVPIISISQKRIGFGENICVGEIGFSNVNVYHQILVGAKAAKTEYVALCEDDALYTPSHFTSYRPKDCVGYNFNSWLLFTWMKEPLFSIKHRVNSSQCIAPRDLIVKSLEERFLKLTPKNSRWCNEVGRHENHMGVNPVRIESFYSPEPNVIFSHMDCLGSMGLGKKKKMGDERRPDLPPWGKAPDVVKKYIGEEEWQRQINL